MSRLNTKEVNEVDFQLLIDHMDLLLMSFHIFNGIVDYSYSILEFNEDDSDFNVKSTKAQSIVWTTITYDLLCLLSREFLLLKENKDGQFAFRIKLIKYDKFLKTNDYCLNDLFGKKFKKSLLNISNIFNDKYEVIERQYEDMKEKYFKKSKDITSTPQAKINTFLDYQQYFDNKFELRKDNVSNDKYELYYNNTKYSEINSKFPFDVIYKNFKEYLINYKIIKYDTYKSGSNYTLLKSNELVNLILSNNNYFKNQNKNVNKLMLEIEIKANNYRKYLWPDLEDNWKSKLNYFFSKFNYTMILNGYRSIQLQSPLANVDQSSKSNTKIKKKNTKKINIDESVDSTGVIGNNINSSTGTLENIFVNTDSYNITNTGETKNITDTILNTNIGVDTSKFNIMKTSTISIFNEGISNNFCNLNYQGMVQQIFGVKHIFHGFSCRFTEEITTEGTVTVLDDKDEDMAIEDAFSINELDENIIISKKLFDSYGEIDINKSASANFKKLTNSVMMAANVSSSIEDGENSVIRKVILYYILCNVDNDEYVKDNNSYHLDIIQIMKEFLENFDKELKAEMRFYFPDDARKSEQDNAANKRKGVKARIMKKVHKTICFILFIIYHNKPFHFKEIDDKYPISNVTLLNNALVNEVFIMMNILNQRKLLCTYDLQTYERIAIILSMRSKSHQIDAKFFIKATKRDETSFKYVLTIENLNLLNNKLKNQIANDYGESSPNNYIKQLKQITIDDKDKDPESISDISVNPSNNLITGHGEDDFITAEDDFFDSLHVDRDDKTLMSNKKRKTFNSDNFVSPDAQKFHPRKLAKLSSTSTSTSASFETEQSKFNLQTEQSKLDKNLQTIINNFINPIQDLEDNNPLILTKLEIKEISDLYGNYQLNMKNAIGIENSYCDDIVQKYLQKFGKLNYLGIMKNSINDVLSLLLNIKGFDGSNDGVIINLDDDKIVHEKYEINNAPLSQKVKKSINYLNNFAKHIYNFNEIINDQSKLVHERLAALKSYLCNETSFFKIFITHSNLHECYHSIEADGLCCLRYLYAIEKRNNDRQNKDPNLKIYDVDMNQVQQFYEFRDWYIERTNNVKSVLSKYENDNISEINVKSTINDKISSSSTSDNWQVLFPFFSLDYKDFLEWDKEFIAYLEDFKTKKFDNKEKIIFQLPKQLWLFVRSYRVITPHNLKHVVFGSDEATLKLALSDYEFFIGKKFFRNTNSCSLLFTTADIDEEYNVERVKRHSDFGINMSLNQFNSILNDDIQNIGCYEGSHFFPLKQNIVTSKDVNEAMVKICEILFNYFSRSNDYLDVLSIDHDHDPALTNLKESLVPTSQITKINSSDEGAIDKVVDKIIVEVKNDKAKMKESFKQIIIKLQNHIKLLKEEIKSKEVNELKKNKEQLEKKVIEQQKEIQKLSSELAEVKLKL